MAQWPPNVAFGGGCRSRERFTKARKRLPMRRELFLGQACNDGVQRLEARRLHIKFVERRRLFKGADHLPQQDIQLS